MVSFFHLITVQVCSSYGTSNILSRVSILNIFCRDQELCNDDNRVSTQIQSFHSNIKLPLSERNKAHKPNNKKTAPSQYTINED
jgi:hypothetical protein